MKSRLLISMSAASLLAALAMPVRLAAQEQKHELPRYTVTDLGTLGGSFSTAFGINNAGRVGGVAQLSGGNQHAFLWQNGAMTDLGTLGGPNSAAGGPNAKDELAILSETSTADPLGEDFCGFGTHLICLGAVWKNGAMTPLPTLGGNNGIAFSLNDRGQLAGATENSTHDPSCSSPQGLDFEAAIWGPIEGELRELPPLPGDTVGFALAINDRGLAVGSSGSCSNTFLCPFAVGPHAVLWDHGSPIDLGNLGGELINTAAAVNDRGEVVGASDLPGDTTIHTFMWTREAGMKDLGTVGSDVSSLAGWINNEGQVVGWSCDSSGNCRAYLWQSNVMTDLNSLIPADSPLYLLLAFGISDAGEIVGQASEKSTGNIHAFLASPRHGEANNKSAAPVAEGKTNETVKAPENIRELLQQRLRLVGFAGLPIGPQ